MGTRAVVGLLLDHVGDALADTGDTDTVNDLPAAVLQRGNGAAFQRSAYRRSGSLTEVVSSAAAATTAIQEELQTAGEPQRLLGGLPTPANRKTAKVESTWT